MNRRELLELRMELPVWCACRCHGAETGGIAATRDATAAALACSPCRDRHVATLMEWPDVDVQPPAADLALIKYDEEDGC